MKCAPLLKELGVIIKAGKLPANDPHFFKDLAHPFAQYTDDTQVCFLVFLFSVFGLWFLFCGFFCFCVLFCFIYFFQADDNFNFNFTES